MTLPSEIGQDVPLRQYDAVVRWVGDKSLPIIGVEYDAVSQACPAQSDIPSCSGVAPIRSDTLRLIGHG